MVFGNTGAIRQIAANPKTGIYAFKTQTLYAFKTQTLSIECMLVDDNFIKKH